MFNVTTVMLALFALATQPAYPLPSLPDGQEDTGYNRPIQDVSTWEKRSEPLLTNFCNMYQPCVLEFPNNTPRFRMWFFGWATSDGNPGYPGCDAIFYACSDDMIQWRVYSGDDKWDTIMSPSQWKPVLWADTKPYDEWHNGDPSVVFHDGRFYMAYSATGKPFEQAVEGRPNGMFLCIRGAISDDGIHWSRLPAPLLFDADPASPDIETQEDGIVDYHRPSLMWDQGKWRLWFDYWHPHKGVCMGYAENPKAFDAPNGFQIMHDLKTPLISNWPNPEVIRVGKHYVSFADPVGYPPLHHQPDAIWRSRVICQAESADGLGWTIKGFVPPDDDTAACHVPQALVTEYDGKKWLNVFYATQRGGTNPYDFRYDRIRAMRTPITE